MTRSFPWLASFGTGEYRTWTYTDYAGWDIQTYDAGYSGCTCPGVDPWAIQCECTKY